MQIRSAKDLTVYKRAYELAMRTYDMSRRFPAEERFALTNHREDHAALTGLAAEVGKMLGAMIQQPQKFKDQRSDL